MYMDEPPLMGSDSQPAVAIPQQLLRIDLAVGKESVAIHRAVNRNCAEFIGDDLLEPCAEMPNISRPSPEAAISPTRACVG